MSYNIAWPNEPELEGQFIIEEKWTDVERNTWYRVRTDVDFYGDFFTLIRINASEDTFEFEEASYRYPEQFSSFMGEKYRHKILYRQ